MGESLGFVSIHIRWATELDEVIFVANQTRGGKVILGVGYPLVYNLIKCDNVYCSLQI